MSGSKYLAVCPVEPVEKICPVELEIITYEMPIALTYETFSTVLLPPIISALLLAYCWRALRRMVLNKL